MRLLFIALLVSFPSQEPTLEQVIEKMEQRASQARDVRFQISSMPTGMLADFLGGGFTIDAAFVRGGYGRMRWKANREAPAFAWGGVPKPEDMEFTYRPEGIDVLQQQALRGKNAGTTGLPRVALRLVYGDPRTKKWDPIFMPDSASMHFLFENPLFSLALQPKAVLRGELDLKLAETRVIEGRKVHVLRSARDVDESADGGSGMLGKRLAKTFYVDAEIFAVRRLEMKMSGLQGGSAASITMECLESKTLKSGFELPVRARVLMEWNEMMASMTYGSEQRVTGLAEDTGLSREDVAASSEEQDLHADAAPSDKEVTAKDAQSAYALAVARNGRGDLTGMQKKTVEDDKLIQPLEKALEFRPGSAVVESNLVVLYARSKKEALGPLLDLISAREKVPSHLAVTAAWALNGIGKHEAALKRLEGVSGPEAAAERMAASLALKRPKDAAAAFAKAAREMGSLEDRLAFVQMLEDSEAAPADLSAELDEIQKSDPKDAAIRALRIRIRMKAKQTEAALEGLADASLLAPGFGRLIVDDLLAAKDDASASDLLPKVRAALEAIEKAGDPDPRVPRVLAAWLEKTAATECEAAYRRAIEKCASTEGDSVFNKRKQQLVAELAVQFDKESRPELAAEAGRAFLKHARLQKTLPYTMLFQQDKNPMKAVVGKYVAAKDYAGLFKEIKGIEMPDIFFQAAFDQFLPGADLGELIAAGEKDLFSSNPLVRKSPPLEDVLWFARFLQAHQKPAEAVKFLDRATGFYAKDTRVLFPLLEAQGKAGQVRDAVGTCEKILALDLKGEGPPRERILQRQSGFLMSLGEKEKAKAALDQIEVAKAGLLPWELWKMATDYESIGDIKRAIAALKRAVDLEAKPYVRLAQLCEKVEDYVNAVRYYRRAIADGYDASLDAPSSTVVRVYQPNEDDSKKAPSDALKKLLDKLGPDYFVDRFLSGKFEPLSEEESRRAKDAVEKLQSDKIDERDEAVSTLKKIGPRVAPLLKDLAKSQEEEVRSRVRDLLNDWALPK